ncbi:hypothetical protein [Aromatoleum anaerobium]|uniref:Uncharacterized protein n=1 Tax=Aromatoleum anaerobium TaxID=182180 RepID=A0ABX1PMC3_9RHOO|nr:hypothetical protein [Aromatoleum anaerobium]MCK0506866.1 hypothetical protein [Aromatoleum anaerobium]
MDDEPEPVERIGKYDIRRLIGEGATSVAALEDASGTCRMHFYKAFLDVLSTRLPMANSRIANAGP